MDTQMLLIVGAIFLAAGVVKGVSGMGLPTLSMALLGLVLHPAAAAALMVGPSLLTNVAQCLGPHWRELLRRLWPMWLALALLTLFSPLPDLAGSSSGRGARLTLGVVLQVYGLWGLYKPTLPDLGKRSSWIGAVAGALSGVLTASTGVSVMPQVPYLQALRLPKEALLQAMGITFTIATAGLAIRLNSLGASAPVDLWAAALSLGPALLGMRIGAALLGRLSPALFQRLLYGVFLTLGLLMVGRSL